MQGMIEKWDDSAAVRIPPALLEAVHLGLDQPVDVREEGGRIVISPLDLPRCDLAALVAGITDENCHEPAPDKAPDPHGAVPR